MRANRVLREDAEFYKVDMGAITAKVKQEFVKKDKVKAAKTAAPKVLPVLRDIASVDLLLYGGWYQNNKMARRANNDLICLI